MLEERARREQQWTVLLLGTFLLLSLAMRLVYLDRQPWGLHEDQLVHGNDVLQAVAEQRPFRLTEYNLWVNAAAFRWLGVSPVAQRVFPALVGSLFPLSTYLALQAMFGRRVALLAALTATSAIWPLVLSRGGLSISYLPVVMGLLIWQASLGWRAGRARHWVAAGLLLAAAQYIYYPARVLLPILGLSALFAFVAGDRQRLRTAWPLAPAFLLAVVPLFFDSAQRQAESTRYAGVFVLAADDSADGLLTRAARQVWAGVSMFVWRGDANARHNIPFRPVFDALTAIFAFIGLGRMLRAWRRQRHLFCFLWIGLLSLPTLLSIDSPHFLRASGILPLVFVLPALGLDGAWTAAAGRRWLPRGPALAAVVAIFSLANTLYAYLGGPYAGSRELYLAFNGNETELAVTVNRFLEVGWQGSGWRATRVIAAPARQVIMDQRLWDGRFRQEALRLLVPVSPLTSEVFAFTANGRERPQHLPPADEAEMRLIVVPGSEQPAVELLPHDRLIRVEDGPLTPHGPAAPPLFRAYTATRSQLSLAPALACFEDGIELLAADLRETDEAVGVTLTWRARTKPAYDYTVFTHVLAQEQLVGQVDSFPAAGHYLTSWWRPGDIVADERLVPIPAGTALQEAAVRVGLYRLDTGSNLAATDCAGTALGEFVVFPLADQR